MTHSAYDTDYCEWAQQQIALLASRQFDKLDIGHLTEELGEMGNTARNEIESRLTVLLAHLLKLQFQPEQQSRSWLGSIREQRIRLSKTFRKNPSLQSYPMLVLDECYQDAVKIAMDDTGLARNCFPAACPYRVEQALDETFLPKHGAI